MEEIYCFGGNPLDRASERRRDTVWIQSLLDDPAARILPLCELRPLIRGEAVPELDWQPDAPWRERIARGAMLVFLWFDKDRPYFAPDGGPSEVAPAGQHRPIDVRTLAPMLSGGAVTIRVVARS